MNLEAVYPNENNPNEEMSFEELRANSRGWLSKDWATEHKPNIADQQLPLESERQSPIAVPLTAKLVEVQNHSQSQQDSQPETHAPDSLGTTIESTMTVDFGREGRSGRPRKTKLKEVKGETQTSMYQKYFALNLG